MTAARRRRANFALQRAVDLGLDDRPWGPERPVYGTVRCLSSAVAHRKLDLESYLRAWGRPA
jgi:deoxyribodipyrimidine photo-lyase